MNGCDRGDLAIANGKDVPTCTGADDERGIRHGGGLIEGQDDSIRGWDALVGTIATMWASHMDELRAQQAVESRNWAAA
jgi:hypothetical protein